MKCEEARLELSALAAAPAALVLLARSLARRPAFDTSGFQDKADVLHHTCSPSSERLSLHYALSFISRSTPRAHLFGVCFDAARVGLTGPCEERPWQCSHDGLIRPSVPCTSPFAELARV